MDVLATLDVSFPQHPHKNKKRRAKRKLEKRSRREILQEVCKVASIVFAKDMRKPALPKTPIFRCVAKAVLGYLVLRLVPQRCRVYL